MAILGPLRALDPVAYLRFASVYKAFSSADDFEDEIALLRMEQDAALSPDRRSSLSRPGARATRRTHGITHRPPGPGVGKHTGRVHHSPVVEERAPASHRTTVGRRSRDDNRDQREQHEGHEEQFMTETVNPTKGSAKGGRQGPDHRACLQHARHPPLRRAHLGAPRRRPAELEDRRDGLRAARRGVPRLLERQRLHDRHHQVLPRRGRHRRPRVEPQAADRPGREDLHQGRQSTTGTSRPRRTPRPSSTS